jgi:polyisoprenoid-binding protein YceI
MSRTNESGRPGGTWLARVGRSAALVASVCAPLGAAAREATLTLDPAAAQIHFEVDSTLHRVEGSARLVSGVLHFDPSGGGCSGAIEVDATSLETGNRWRDAKLHADVLESQTHPRILFRAQRLVVERRSDAEADVRVEGTLELHGSPRPFDIAAGVHRDGDTLEIDARFELPYLDWGLEDPSSFLLSVDKIVRVGVHARGRLEPAPD